MANRAKKTTQSYEKIENIVMNQLFNLENENAHLKNELAIANAKLEVYERLASISNERTQLGFGPPSSREEG